MVNITCLRCGRVHAARAGQVASDLRAGKFSGLCKKDNKVGKPWKAEWPEHPSVDYSKQRVIDRPTPACPGRRVLEVLVKCPACSKERWISPSLVRVAGKRGDFTGYCARCVSNPSGNNRYVNCDGYVMWGRPSCPEELREWFDMAKTHIKSKRVLAHRLVMTAHLKRALLKHEVVHHKNGVRTDNRLENLRLFKRGEHHPGYGDFYQEWQEALRDKSPTTHADSVPQTIEA